MTRRGLRLWLVVGGVLLALVAGSVLALPAIVRQVVLRQAASQTGRAVSLERAEVAPFRGRLALVNFRVLDHDGQPLATVERFEVRFRPRDLLRGHLRILDGVLQAPSVRLVRKADGTFNVADLIKPGGEGGGASATIDRFVVQDGVVTIEDRAGSPGRTWRIDGVALEVRDASTADARGVVTMRASVAGAPVTLDLSQVRLGPVELRGTLTARDVDLGLASLLMPPSHPLDAPRGFLNATMTLEQGATSGARVGADVQLRDVELRRRGQARALVTAPSIRVMGDDLRAQAGTMSVKRLAVDGGAIALEDERLGAVTRWQATGVAFEARDLSSAPTAPPGTATARAALAGAELSAWAGQVRLAPAEAHATVIVRNLDLAIARLYLPPDLPVQPERGVIDATLRVDHDGTKGTRLALDAGLRDVELRRPAHHVIAPALRVTADGIALAGDAVTIGAVRIDGPRLRLEERTATPVRTWFVRDVVVDAKDLSSRRDAVQGVARLTAAVGLRGSRDAGVGRASVSVFVTRVRLDPLEAHATAILRDVDLGLVRLYLTDAPLDAASGLANVSVDADYSVADGGRANVDATFSTMAVRVRTGPGPIAFTAPALRVTMADARSKGAALSVARVELTGSGSVIDPRAAASRVDLADLRVGMEQLTWPVDTPARVTVDARFRDRGQLQASGTARLTAPLPTVAWQADLALKFRGVDLAPVGEYVAAARGVGGRVRADVTATVTYAGTLSAQVRGDVGGGRFALAEGGTTLLALRRIDVTGLDAQWPERVTIQQVKLREPFAHVERDRHGTLPLLTRFAPPPGDAPPTGERALAAGPSLPTVTIGQLIVEQGRATFTDAVPPTPARIELARFDLDARDVTWPPARPVKVVLDAQLPEGGTLRAEGAVSEPAVIDLTVAVKRGQIAPLQPYFDVPGVLRARFDATLAVKGPLTPSPRVAVRGDIDIRRFSIADGTRRVLTVERLRVGGIDGTWPESFTIDSARAEKSWAMLERDRQGDFTLRRLLTKPPRAATTAPAPSSTAPGPAATPATPAANPPAAAPLAVRVREVIFEQQNATIVDATTTPPARMEIAGARLVMRDFAWPLKDPVGFEVTSPTPVSGRLSVKGAVTLEPVRIEARAVLDDVSIEPAQPYLPIPGHVAGRVTGDLGVDVTLEPLAVRVTGDARLSRFRLNDGDRPLVAVGRLEAGGLDVDWPRRIAVRSVLLRRPRLLVERDAQGDIILLRVATPRWEHAPAASAPAPTASTAPGTPAVAPPVIEVATFTLERAEGRFVDLSITPPFADDVSDVQLVLSNFTTAPGRRTRFTGKGEIVGGTFTLTGEDANGQSALDLKVDMRGVVIPRANAYLVHFTGWTVSRGSLDAQAVYTLHGTRLDAKHELVVRGLELASPQDRDEVERRTGLPFGVLVSLLKDARGEIKVSLPVSGDIGTREFSFDDAVWSAVRALAIRVIAAPFSRVGSLFVSQDSRVTGVAIKPIVFESGAAQLAPGMDAHVEQIGGLLKTTPAIKLQLDPIFTQADVDALKRDQVRMRLAETDALEGARRAFRERWPEREVPATLEAIVAALAAAEPSPADALRALGRDRLDLVRQALTKRGGVDPERLAGNVRRSPLVEAGGVPRVELDLRP